MSQNWWKWGKIIYSVPLSITGLIYLVNPQGTVETFTSFIPGGLNLVYLGGVLWVMLGLSIAFNVFARWAAWGIIYLIGAYVIMIHVPALTAGDHMNIVLFEFLRNLSLLGGAFFILAVEPAPKKAEEKHLFPHLLQ